MNPSPPGISVRSASVADTADMLAIGDSADRLFAEHGYPQIPALPPASPEAFRDFVAGNRAWLALLDGRPAGFAVAGKAAGAWWLKEIAVDPAVGRRGIGSALLEAVIDDARGHGHAEIVLSTFRDVPFNAPFYARLGFVGIEPADAPEAWREQFIREVPERIDPRSRILMVLAL